MLHVPRPQVSVDDGDDVLRKIGADFRVRYSAMLSSSNYMAVCTRQGSTVRRARRKSGISEASRAATLEPPWIHDLVKLYKLAVLLGLERDPGVATALARLGGTAFASADPYVFVDPNDPNALISTVLVSDGVGNGPAPPAGAPGPIAGAGLPGMLVAVAGLLGWRRMRNDAAAA